MQKKATAVLRVLIIIFAWAAGGYTLYKYEFFSAFGDIDHVVGMVPVALVLTGAVGITVLLLMKHVKRLAPVSAVVALLVILSVALFPTALKANWWIGTTTPGGQEAAPDLTAYAPFAADSKAVKLSEESTLLFTHTLPVMDGATALYPVYAAFAQAVYDETAFSPDNVLCTNTRGAYEAVISGERDIIFAAGASAQQLAAAKAAGADLHFTPIGHEAFIFLVGKENPITNITYSQIRNIYSGKTANWGTLGWPEGGKIIAFQRPEGSGSQTGLQKIMGNIPIQVPQPLPDASLTGTNSLMKQVSVTWQGVMPAIGYSYRYYATTMYANSDAKILSVDSLAPSAENIQNKTYPFTADFYAVTNGKPAGNVKLLIDWILSPQGQEIIQKTGYIPLSENV